jgi:hypothetical protein
MKLTGVNTHTKKTYLCCEHVQSYKSYKHIKANIKKLKTGELSIKEPKDLTERKIIITKVLIELNNLIKFDAELKRLFINIEGVDIINFLLNLLGQKDKSLDLLVLMNIYLFIKDIDIARKYNNFTFFNAMVSYLFTNNFDLYSNKQKLTITEISLFLTITNILGIFYKVMKDKVVESNFTYELLMFLFNLLVKLLDDTDIKEKYKKHAKTEIDEGYLNFINANQGLLYDSIISLVYSVLTSKIDYELKIQIINFFLENQEYFINFLVKGFVNSQINSELVFIEVLDQCYYTKVEDLHQNLNMFLKNLGKIKISQDKLVEMIKLLQEKLKLSGSVIGKTI